MQEFDLSYDILNDVFDHNQPFNEALRKVFQTSPELRPMRSDVAALVGCTLRHHHLFDYLTKPLEMEEADRRYVYLALGNNYFSRHFEKADMNECVRAKLGDEKFTKVEALLNDEGTDRSHIPANISRSSNLYLSLRFNTPDWVLKVFEHFGFGTTYKILNRLSRPMPHTYRVRTSNRTVESVLENPEFQKTELPGLVTYTGKSRLNKNPLYASMDIFEERAFSRRIIEENLVKAPEQVLLYNGNASPELMLDLIETYGDTIGLNIACDDTERYAPVHRLIRNKGLRNVNFFSSPQCESLASAVSQPQELVIVAPNSTNFDLIPLSPDYLLHFDKSEMDAIIKNQGIALENASQFVEVGGKLIYCVYTISMKEGIQTLRSFFANHKDFRIESHKQYFPFEKDGCCAYMAVLTKLDHEEADPFGTYAAKIAKDGKKE